MLVQEGWFNVFLIVTAVDDFQRQSDTGSVPLWRSDLRLAVLVHFRTYGLQL